MATTRWSRRLRLMAATAVIAVGGLGAAACSNTSSTGASGGNTGSSANAVSQVVNSAGTLAGRPSLNQFCGTKKITVALADGFGGNSWRKIVHYLFDLDAKQCPNITKVYYTNANGNPAQYTSDIQGLVAQGVNVIVTYDDFGPAGLPAIRAAYKAGVQIVPYISEPGGTPGTDYTTFVALNAAATGQAWAKWLNEALGGNGTTIMLGGTPGNGSSPGYLKGFEDSLASYPGLKLVSTTPVTTNWTVAGEQQGMAGVLSHYPGISSVMTDYLATYGAVLRAYQAAGKQPGPVAGFTSSNADGCLWQQYHAQYPKWQMFSVDGDPNAVSMALRKGVAAAEGKADPEPDTLTMTVSIDTVHGKMPKCDSSLPPDTDFSTPLTAAQLHQALG